MFPATGRRLPLASGKRRPVVPSAASLFNPALCPLSTASRKQFNHRHTNTLEHHISSRTTVAPRARARSPPSRASLCALYSCARALPRNRSALRSIAHGPRARGGLAALLAQVRPRRVV
jgi:hypothetical protein